MILKAQVKKSAPDSLQICNGGDANGKLFR
jgi:hypothetical protein